MALAIMSVAPALPDGGVVEVIAEQIPAGLAAARELALGLWRFVGAPASLSFASWPEGVRGRAGWHSELPQPQLPVP